MANVPKRGALPIVTALAVALALAGGAAAASLPLSPAAFQAPGAGAGETAEPTETPEASETPEPSETPEAAETPAPFESPAADQGDAQGPHGALVSAAAQSTTTGGLHDNHGGYVSCVARGGTNCDPVTSTAPVHGNSTHHHQGSGGE